MLHLIVTALWPHGFDLEITHKPGGNLSAGDLRMKIWFAAADNDRVSRRKLMAHLGKKGAASRMKKLGKRERTKIARQASKAAAIKRSERAAARAQTQSEAAPKPPPKRAKMGYSPFRNGNVMLTELACEK
jgi:hypothetical protein